MPYKSTFTYVNEIPADAEKVEKVRDKSPRELYWSPSQKKFYCKYYKDDKLLRMRELQPGKKGYVYARSTEGKSICIVMNKWLKDHGIDPATQPMVDREAAVTRTEAANEVPIDNNPKKEADDNDEIRIEED